MEFLQTALPEVLILEPKVFGDHRGYFTETWSEREFQRFGLSANFVQDNESFTAKKGTLRGIHFQQEPMAQLKVVRVTQGAVMDVAVDLRVGSPRYLQWVAVELSAENHRQLLLPRGFGHGFVTLTDQVLFTYKVDRPYSPECDRGIRFDDPQIAVDWGISDPILSEKDQNSPFLKDSDCNFRYEEK